MKKHAILLSGLILFTLSFNSCKQKKEQESETQQSRSELLTAHNWKGVEVVRFVNGNETTHTSIASYKYVFSQDNHYKKLNNNGIEQDGTWEIVGQNSFYIVRTRYTVSQVNYLDDLNIIELSENDFSFYMPVIDGSGDIIRDEYHYKK